MRSSLEEAVVALAGTDDLPSTEAPRLRSGQPSTQGWSREALEQLDEAEQRLRQGDYQGFGEALEELRSLLQQLAREPGGD